MKSRMTCAMNDKKKYFLLSLRVGTVLNTELGCLTSLNPQANHGRGSILHAINLQKDFVRRQLPGYWQYSLVRP